MDIFLAHEDSLRVLRHARREDDLALIPAAGEALHRDHSRIDPRALQAALPSDVLSPRRAQPVSLRFEDDVARSQCGIVRAIPNLARMPDDSYLEVVSSSGSPLSSAGGEAVHLFVESAGLSLITAAQSLGELVRQERLTRRAALVRLSGFLMELCGSYARDPLAPSSGEVVYDLPPVSSVSEATSFLESARGLHGRTLALMAAGHANDGSGSTMETLWYHAFCLPPRLGGMHLRRPLQNVPLQWPDEVSGLVSHQTMRPDFYWASYHAACEHQGKDHTSEEALAEDCDRARDYELCGIDYFPVTKKDARSEKAVRAFLAQLIEKFAPYEGPSFRRRMRQRLDDPDVVTARNVLLSQLRPASRRWQDEDAQGGNAQGGNA